MQHFLKPAPGAAWALVVTAEFLHQYLAAVDDARTTLDLRLAQGTPGDVCWSAQKEASESRSFLFLAIQPPCLGEAWNLTGPGGLGQPNDGQVVEGIDPEIPPTRRPLRRVPTRRRRGAAADPGAAIAQFHDSRRTCQRRAKATHRSAISCV